MPSRRPPRPPKTAAKPAAQATGASGQGPRSQTAATPAAAGSRRLRRSLPRKRPHQSHPRSRQRLQRLPRQRPSPRRDQQSGRPRAVTRQSPVQHRRHPKQRFHAAIHFESLTSRQEAAARAGANLPPGKAGLQVGTLRLDGIVRAPNGMIAVVTNPQARTYFLREGDQLYDGRVEKIAMDGVSFHEVGKDAFGKPVERQVNKRIYSSAGEQQ